MTLAGENAPLSKELQHGMIHNTDKNSTLLLKACRGGLPHPGWGYQEHLSRSDTQAETWRKSKTGQGIKDKSVPGRSIAFRRLRTRKGVMYSRS